MKNNNNKKQTKNCLKKRVMICKITLHQKYRGGEKSYQKISSLSKLLRCLKEKNPNLNSYH